MQQYSPLTGYVISGVTFRNEIKMPKRREWTGHVVLYVDGLLDEFGYYLLLSWFSMLLRTGFNYSLLVLRRCYFNVRYLNNDLLCVPIACKVWLAVLFCMCLKNLPPRRLRGIITGICFSQRNMTCIPDNNWGNGWAWQFKFLQRPARVRYAGQNDTATSLPLYHGNSNEEEDRQFE